MDADESADARTRLAVERTMLAWWRTGLASLAVAIGVGRLLPELSDASHTWPYVALGIAFAVYAGGLFLYGTVRARAADVRPSATALAIATTGMALAVATIALIAAG